MADKNERVRGFEQGRETIQREGAEKQAINSFAVQICPFMSDDFKKGYEAGMDHEVDKSNKK